MGRFFAVLVQFVLFLVTFLAGGFLKPIGMRTVLAADALHTRVFVWDGLLLMLVLYGLVLVLEAVLGKIRQFAGWSTLALAVAAGLGLMMKFGFVSTDR